MDHSINAVDKLEQARAKERMVFGIDDLTSQFNIIDVDSSGRSSNKQYVWDTVSLAWVAASAAGGVIGGGGSASTEYAEITTITGGYAYNAKAAPGSSTSSAVWQVNRTSLTDPFTTTWANGNKNFSNVATNLPSLSYS